MTPLARVRWLFLAVVLAFGVCQPMAAQSASRPFADLGRYLPPGSASFVSRETEERVQAPSSTDASTSPTWIHSNRRVTELPRVSAKELLGTQGVATSFAAVQRMLKPGHEVIVAFGGREIRGRVALITNTRLVVVRRQVFRTQEIVLTDDTVQRIKIVDSAADGAGKGAAVGLGFATALAVACSVSSSCRNGNFGVPGSFIVSSALFVPQGIALGYSIDLSLNEPIYERPSQVSRVTLAPQLGRDVLGLFAHVGF